MKKKHPNLPNSFGCIRYLGKGRQRPYAVHPPSVDRDRITGHYIRPKALCYVDNWYTGFAVLMAYRSGTYKPGDELDLKPSEDISKPVLDKFCERIIHDYSLVTGSVSGSATFGQVYDEFFEWKFGEHAAKKLSKSSEVSSKTAFRNLKPLHDKPIAGLMVNDLQKVLNECQLKEASLELMVSCLKQVFKFAESRGYIEKDISKFVVMPQAEGDEHGIPFTHEDIHKLWSLSDDPTAEFLLIMIYSGFRIGAFYRGMEINLEERYFKGGVKTKAGKGRIVPIHHFILPLVEKRLARKQKSQQAFRVDMKEFLEENGIEFHTPHDCRHTFSMLCEESGVSENDRKRMLGHSFGADITNGVYGHRSLEDLRAEIEKIKFR